MDAVSLTATTSTTSATSTTSRRVSRPPLALAPLATGVAVLALVVADILLNKWYAGTREDGPPLSWATLVWAARADLLVLIALAGLVAFLLLRGGPPAQTQAPWPSGVRLLVWLPCGALAMAAGVLAGPLSCLMVVAVYLLAMRIGPWLAGARDSRLGLILATGLTLRLLVAIGLGVYGNASHKAVAVLDDEVALHRAALELGAILAVGKGNLQPDWWHLPGPYLSGIGALYWLVDRDFTLVRVANAGIAALAIGVVYGIARALFGAAPARLAACLVAVWPSFVFWTATGLREAAFATVSLLIPWLLARRRDPRTRESALLVGTTVALAAYVVWTLRSYAVVGLAMGVALAGVAPLRPWARRHMRTAALAGVAIGLIGLGAVMQLPGSGWRGPFNYLLSGMSPPSLENRAAAFELSTLVEADPRKRPPPPDPSLAPITAIVRVLPPGETAFHTGVVAGYLLDPVRYRIDLDKDTELVVPTERVQLLTDANVGWDVPLRRLVGGIRLFVVPPAPWESLAHVVTIPDALAWDVLAVLAAYSAWRMPRGSSVTWLVLMAYPLVMVVALALASSYLGTVVRHRSMLIPWLVLLAVPLLERVRTSLRQSALPGVAGGRMPRPSIPL